MTQKKFRSKPHVIEKIYWPEQRCCGHFESTDACEVKGAKPMPYRCHD